MQFYDMSNDSDDKIVIKNPERLTRYREGILYTNRKEKKDPLYIFRQVEQNSVTWVFAYEVSKEDYKQSDGKIIRKAYRKVNVTKTFGDTVLGRMAQKSPLGREKTIVKEAPYIFMSPVIEGRSTLSGKLGKGFFERMPNNSYIREKDRGESTNVFIGMEDIDWEEEYHLDMKNLLKEAGAVKDAGDIYHL